MAENVFRAGAGTAEVIFPEDYFPTGRLFAVGYPENYTGVHDNLLAHVLLIEYGERYALVTLDIVGGWVDEPLREALQRILGVTRENMLFHSTHTLSSPHEFRDPDTSEKKLKNEKRATAISEAVEIAARQAVESLTEAKFGYGFGITNINVNRVMETRDGWWQVSNEEGETDHSLNVFKFETVDGKPIAVLYGVNTASGTLEHSCSSDGGHLISGDIAGASSRFIERELSAKAIYATCATGDQWESMRALHGYLDGNGVYHEKDLHEAGFVFVEVLGDRLGQQVLRTQERIACRDFSGPIGAFQKTFTYPGQKASRAESEGPVRNLEFYSAEPVNADVYVLRLSDAVLVGVTAELNVSCVKYIKEHSPFEQTMVVEFTRGCYDGGLIGYMPDEDFYDRMTYQSRKCRVKKGTAERFREDVIKLLKEIKEGATPACKALK